MISIADLTKIALEPLKEQIIQEYDRKGMRASGDFAESLEIEGTFNGAVIKGNAYGEQLEDGRKPTEKGHSGGDYLIDRIREWIKVKNVVPKDGISEESLAWAITKKIHKEGWDRKDHGGVNLLSDAISDLEWDAAIAIIADEYTSVLVSGVINKYKVI